MSSQYYLPARTEALVQKQIGLCKNLALILDKYPERTAFKDSSSEGRGLWLKKIVQESHLDEQLAQAFYKRWAMMTGKLQATRFSASLSWRMVIGLGGGTALETDLTLHHHYGTPFIPGSALKGLTRAYVAGEEDQYFIPSPAKDGRLVPSREEETDHAELQRIFGTQDQSGTVTFFDAVPFNGKYTFVVDIMNPHYPDYYKTLKSEKKIEAPSNDQAPIPVTFLAINQSIFAFAVAPRDPQIVEHQKDAEKVVGWLQKALQSYGVGGKTSAGYGIFQKDQFDPINDQIVVDQPTQHVPAAPDQIINYRLAIPTFYEGQEILAVVIAPTAQMSETFPEASFYLRYKEYSTQEIFIAIEADSQETLAWKVNETRFCVYKRTEAHNTCTVLVCKPRPPKDKFKNKKKK